MDLGAEVRSVGPDPNFKADLIPTLGLTSYFFLNNHLYSTPYIFALYYTELLSKL